jgi:hypothetical protein
MKADHIKIYLKGFFLQNPNYTAKAFREIKNNEIKINKIFHIPFLSSEWLQKSIKKVFWTSGSKETETML